MMGSKYLGVAMAAFVACLVGCSSSSSQVLTEEFIDNFDRAALGDNWHNTGGPYKIVDGELFVEGAKNHPLWLRKRLPDDVRVTFKARSESPQGDIKFELFGDGRSFARASSYVASGYVLIFGGWHNSKSMIARLDEHGPDVKTKRDRRVEKGEVYRIKAERRGNLLRWWVDDEIMLEFDDNMPLEGSDHEHFAFNNWATPLYFDELRVTPL